jgi:hypothetical chaperone protein
MTTYLALDFGTTNCVAGEISEDLKLNLVPLDINKKEMASAIFLKSKYISNREFNDSLLQKRIEEALKKEIEKEFQNLIFVEKQLNDFHLVKAPRVKIPNEYYTVKQLKLHRYVEPNQFDMAMNYFKENEYKTERSRLLSTLPKKRSESDVREHEKIMLFNEIFESDINLLKEETFFTALLNKETEIFFGSSAILEYTNNPMSGFFMSSPKSFLAISLTSQQIELFTRVIVLFITHIKTISENYLNKKFEGVVIGRPINFMGSSFSNGNDQAIDIIKTAAINSGFKFVRFVYEPLAASLVIEQHASVNNDPILVVDVGGGTTDIAFIEVSSEDRKNLNVKGVAGERIGGNDFDQSLALFKFGPFIGRKITLANSFIVDLVSTRDIHSQTRFRLGGKNLYNLLKNNLDNIDLQRLYQIYRAQLQHKLLLSSENLKISLSNTDNAQETIDYLFPNFNIILEKEEINSICEQHLISIQNNILAAIPEGFRDKPIRVFLTGGMSSVVAVIKIVKDSVSTNSSLRRMNALHSIIAGLSVVARQLSFSESAYDEPNSVRGVQIFKA